MPSHGALPLAGAVTFVIGSLMLFDPAGAVYQVSLTTAVSIAAVLALLMGGAMAKALQARRRPVEVGAHLLVGAHGEVRRDGLVFVNGELWRAHSHDGHPLVLGDEVEVEAVDDSLELVVGSSHPMKGRDS